MCQLEFQITYDARYSVGLIVKCEILEKWPTLSLAAEHMSYELRHSFACTTFSLHP